MAASRRRSSGFTEKPKSEAETEEKEVEEFLDAAATEMFETISQKEEEPAPVVEELAPPVVRQDPPLPAPEPPAVTKPALAPRPKLPRRPQRNVPRFSRVR